MKVKSKKLKKSATKAASKGSGGDGRLRGKKSGLNVSEWWNKAFRVNPKTKLTDAELLSKYKAEFPDRTPQPVGRMRSFYNRGLSGLGTAGERAKVQSVAYDKKGAVTASDWTPCHKPDKKKSKIAKERALKGWRKKSRKPRVDSVRGVAHVAAGKKKSASIKAKKAKVSAAGKTKPTGKKTIKLKVAKKKAA